MLDDIEVLLVDDDETVVAQCKETLEAAGMTVDVAQDGAVALQKARSQCYDITLIELNLPVVSGMEVLARLRHTCPETGVVVITADESAATAVEAMRCGASDYLTKPFTSEELLTAVQQALETKARQAEERRAHGPHEHPADMPPAGIADTVTNKVSVGKATLPWVNVAILGILAGAYIAFGCFFSTTVSSDAVDTLGFGVSKLLAGFTFSVGLILVVVAGGELFTGNNLMLAGALHGKLTTATMLLRWAAVWAANFAGSLMVAGITFGGGMWHLNSDHIGVAALKVAAAKTSLTFMQALLRGIGCNWLVCLAVWMSVAARQVSGKILAIVFPITAFVAVGYEHCVANMYFIPLGIWLRGTELGATQGIKMDHLDWSGCFLGNLLPVTIGNIIGGGVFVGMLYWAAYVRKATQK